jgi:hypothetical protein
MKLRVLVALVMVLATATARANDSGIEGVGGRWRLIQGEHKSVRMESERVEVDLSTHDYRVRASFLFRNEGAATTVTMGFPEGGYGDTSDGKRTSFRDFKTSVDGMPTLARRMPVESREGLYQAHWLKTVRFRRGQTRRVVVSYRAPLGSSVARGYEHFAAYRFTGGNWRGKVSRSDLVVRMRAPGTWAMLPELGGKSMPRQLVKTGFSYTWRNWQAQDDFSVGVVRTVRGWMTDVRRLSDHAESGGPFSEKLSSVYTVTVPGRAPSAVEYAPPALIRARRIWLRLTTLHDALSEVYPAIRKADGSHLRVSLTGDAKTKTAILELPSRRLTFRPGVRDITVQEGRAPLRVRLSEAPFVLSSVMGSAMYVPASPVAALCGLRIESNPEQHVVVFMTARRFPEPVVW